MVFTIDWENIKFSDKIHKKSSVERFDWKILLSQKLIEKCYYFILYFLEWLKAGVAQSNVIFLECWNGSYVDFQSFSH